MVLQSQYTLSSFARDKLKQFVSLINDYLYNYWQSKKQDLLHHTLFEQSQTIQSIATEMIDHIMEHNSRPAKRLRASLIRYGYQLIKGLPIDDIICHNLLTTWASIELIHTWLLIHDDFQDQDSMRRWLPTTHKHYEQYARINGLLWDHKHFGASIAINSGDIALTFGYQLLSQSWRDSHLLVSVLNTMFDGIIYTGFGQTLDVLLEHSQNVSESMIYDLHHSKTWVYTYLTPLLIWCQLAGTHIHNQPVLIDKLKTYAINCGIAFQLQDDVIGLFGDEAKTWKSAYSDIKEGKKTLLILKTLELCSESEKETIRWLWWNHDLTLEQAECVRDIVKSSWALDYSYFKASEYALRAKQIIQWLRSTDWWLDYEALDYLEWIAEYMGIKREH